jgi:hypothetical protein
MAFAIVALALCAACTSSTQRPEGVVEEWLLSLNQGAAGDPGRYGGEAAEEAAAAVLPDWQTMDPGSLDRIEVGMGGELGQVPFRIETTDGDAITGAADVSRCEEGGGGWCVVGARTGEVQTAGTAWSAGADAIAWIWAVLAAVVFTLVAVGLVLAVRRSAGPARA